jgi:uncharacterized protein
MTVVPLLPALALVAAGVLGGLLAGLLGIGGGLVFVPALLWVAHAHGLGEAVSMHVAVATSLGAIVLTSVSSIRAHSRHSNVDWPSFHAMLPGLVLGAVAGAAIAMVFTGFGLRALFAVFLFVMALRLFLVHKDAPEPVQQLPGRFGLFAAGCGIATLSALLGIGGGTLTVPLLLRWRMTVVRAIGTAAAVGLPIAVAGMLGFMVAGVGVAGLPSHALGFVWWPAALVVGGLAMVTAPLGARLTQHSDPRLLRRLFAVMLVVIAATIVFPASN